MNVSDFSSPNSSYAQLLNRLFGQTNSTDSLADPIQQLPHTQSVGSSWETRLATEPTNSPVTRLSELSLGLLTARTSMELIEPDDTTATIDPLGAAANTLETSGLLKQPLAATSAASVPYPGYVLRYSPGWPLETRAGVAQWQSQMQERGWSLTVDGFYGEESAEVARQFQAEKGLSVDGVVGIQTWKAAFDTSTITGVNEPQNDPVIPAAESATPSDLGSALSYSPLRPLAFDPQAQVLQQRLQTLGWEIEADGWFGPRSAAATRRFQQQHNLDADGIVGPQTWAAVFADNALTAPTQQNLNPVAATNRINAAGLELIKSFEGLRLNAYLDAVGVWTIGYGHTKTAGPGQRVSFAGATALLQEDVATFEKAVTQAVRVPITANQYAALVSFAYNVGSGALNSSTLLRRLNAGDSYGAANEFLRWNRAGGRVLAGLTRRREAERLLFLS